MKDFLLKKRVRKTQKRPAFRSVFNSFRTRHGENGRKCNMFCQTIGGAIFKKGGHSVLFCKHLWEGNLEARDSKKGGQTRLQKNKVSKKGGRSVNGHRGSNGHFGSNDHSGSNGHFGSNGHRSANGHFGSNGHDGSNGHFGSNGHCGSKLRFKRP